MNRRLEHARQLSGLARFERESRRKVLMGGRMRLAYKVPGTREAGQWTTLRAETQRILRKEATE